MPACKEPWFFAEELRHRMPPRPEGTPATLAEYGALFAPAGPGQIAGEATAPRPKAAVDLPLPGPVLMRTRPLREEDSAVTRRV